MYPLSLLRFPATSISPGAAQILIASTREGLLFYSFDDVKKRLEFRFAYDSASLAFSPSFSQYCRDKKSAVMKDCILVGDEKAYGIDHKGNLHVTVYSQDTGTTLTFYSPLSLYPYRALLRVTVYPYIVLLQFRRSGTAFSSYLFNVSSNSATLPIINKNLLDKAETYGRRWSCERNNDCMRNQFRKCDCRHYDTKQKRVRKPTCPHDRDGLVPSHSSNSRKFSRKVNTLLTVPLPNQLFILGIGLDCILLKM